MYSPSIKKLIDIFSRFPTVGRRTASRFSFYLIKIPQSEREIIAKAIIDLGYQIKICAFCFNPFEGGDNLLCPVCNNKKDKSVLCIVEKETDLISIETAKKYNGLYFILGGTVNTLKKEDIDKLRIKELEERIKNPENFINNNPDIKEIIIAINPTIEGEATSLLLERRIKAIQMPGNKILPKITRLGRGLPIGGELEYADDETLGSAFEGRK